MVIIICAVADTVSVVLLLRLQACTAKPKLCMCLWLVAVQNGCGYIYNSLVAASSCICQCDSFVCAAALLLLLWLLQVRGCCSDGTTCDASAGFSMLQVVLTSMLLLLAELNDTKRLYQEPWAESRARAYVVCLRM